MLPPVPERVAARHLIAIAFPAIIPFKLSSALLTLSPRSTAHGTQEPTSVDAAATMAKGKATRPRVYARLRPMFGRDAGQEPLFKVEDGCALEYKKEEAADVSRFTFDKVFGMESEQEEVFAEIGEVALDSLRKGFNSTILAYGQTGSGKTFSMEGAKDSS